MILLIDAGNTRVKWALAEVEGQLGAWRASGAVTHADLPQLEMMWGEATADQGVDRILIANVAGNALRVHLEYVLQRTFPALLPHLGIEWFASVPRLAGITNGYRNPAQLGCDRFAAAIGGHTLAPGLPIIVVNCGTATTIDAVTADGRFLGGMILPGLGLMASSLARNTAQLPQIAQDGKLPDGFADNTDDAILSGILAAQSGAIEHACAAHQAAECIISGGAAPYIAPMLKVPYRIVENIVLTGLHAASRGSAE
ncbi:type III pantothenate kinase [Duganella callida]|uniref:Type III pantothenate kinase n=1 Tax=Duganella callida TaxID=2561932 RepID=A0A4Y9SLH3_9BURK|nr:type III pantothenate kinase [Duganella callida]TFW24857.1 type III pantothenate kinase [Duganella callida]